MHFEHSSEIWGSFPDLVPGVLYAEGIVPGATVEESVNKFYGVAESRLAGGPESEFPEIQAWRRAFSAMGFKPTQYRCASESLLRRFRKEKSLPRLTPVIDLCNAISLAFAIPIAVFDTECIDQFITVRHATGDEEYLTFSKEIENPGAREVIFADGARQAHARRWTNRQSLRSAVNEGTSRILIVAEAMHGAASADVARLIEAVSGELGSHWDVSPRSTILSAASPRFDF